MHPQQLREKLAFQVMPDDDVAFAEIHFERILGRLLVPDHGTGSGFG